MGTTTISEIIALPIDVKPFSREVRVIIVGETGLAYHRRIVAQPGHQGFWDVTHMATKQRFPMDFESDVEAEKFILRLNEFCDCTSEVPTLRTLDDGQFWRMFGLVSYGLIEKIRTEQEAA